MQQSQLREILTLTYSSFLRHMFCQLSRLSVHNHHLVLCWEKRSAILVYHTSCLRSVHLTLAYPVAIVSQIQPSTSATLILQEMRKSGKGQSTQTYRIHAGNVPYSTYYPPMMYYPPTPFFGQKLCGRVLIYILSAHLYRGTAPCTGNDNDSRPVSDKHIDGFEKSQFWHSSLDRQLRLSITSRSLTTSFSFP